MRIYACAAALSLLCHVSFALNDPLLARQDGGQPPPAPSTTSALSPSSNNHTNTPDPTSTSQSTSHRPVTTTSLRTSSVSVSEDAHTPTPTFTSTPTATNTSLPNNGTMYDPSEDLPIVVDVTPAYGVAGTILMLSGIVYCLVGVRLKAIQICFSMCYLVAIAITVLIVYVARPPISNAVQGAYFVGVLLPGVILGGVALIFPEITEGLGCLLGGFCFGMWLLCLKSGGLLDNSGGRIAIIASFSVAAFALSFSKYTKTYGLIVTISFAGATITVLGIDCFTRAGLKEFWVYLWDLNQQLFPLGTDTFPLTRGMKAEIAGIIIVFLAGVISQMKLWKIIKERREKKTSAREQDEEDREHLEADLGRQINETNNRERAEWEAMYNKERGDISSIHDSTYDSTFESNHTGFDTPKQNAALSIKEVYPPSTDTIEMTDMTAARAASRRESRVGGVIDDEDRDSQHRVTIRVAQDSSTRGNVASQSQWDLNEVEDPTPRGSAQPSTSPSLNQGDPSARLLQTRSKEQVPLASSVTPAPRVVPLPFKVPEEQQEDNSDTESQATAGVSVRDGEQERKRPERFSIIPNARYSMSAYDDDDETGFVQPVIPVQQHSRASSVAATLDEMTDDGSSRNGSSRPSSPINGEDDEVTNGISIIKRQSATSQRSGDAITGTEAEGEAQDGVPPSEQQTELDTTATEHSARDLGQILGLSTSPAAETPGTVKAMKSQKSIKRGKRVSIQSDVPSENSLSSNKPLPEKLSNIAMAYRTNEWAKHLEVADTPELEDLSSPPSPGIAVERVLKEEAAPVRIEDLQQNATTAMINNAAQNSAPNSTLSQGFGRSVSNPQSTLKRTSSNPYANSIYAPPGIQRSTTSPASNRNSLLSLKRSASQSALYPPGIRNGSTPILSQPLHESPIEDNPDALLPNQPMPGQTLLSQRETLMRNKMTSTSFNNLSTIQSAPSINGISPSDSGSIRNVSYQQDDDDVSLSSLKQQLMDEENMTLSQRRQLMQQRQAEIQQQQLQAQLQMQNPMAQPGAAPHPHIYDSHQPRRGSTLDSSTREARFANWRETMRRETGPTESHLRTIEADRNRAVLLQNQRQAQMQIAQQKWANNMREVAIDERMRNGQMIDLHKMALKRMESGSRQEQHQS